MVVEIQDEVIEFPRQPTDLDHPVEALSTGAQRNLQQAVHQRPAAGPAVHLRSTPLQSFPQQSGASNIQFTTTQEGAETGGTGAQRHVSHQVNNYVAGGTSTIHYGDIFINPNRTIFDFADKNESKDQKFLIAKKSKHQTKRLVCALSLCMRSYITDISRVRRYSTEGRVLRRTSPTKT